MEQRDCAGGNDAAAHAAAKALYESEATSRAWSICFEDAGAGWARGAMVVRKDMLNGHGTVHGAMIFALADTVFAWACNSDNVRSVAQQASISFLSPANPGETLSAVAREDAKTGRTGVYTVTVTGVDERVIAVFQGLARTIGGAVIDRDAPQNND
ncbi:MAG: hydroxyphenylacetyl-CoA thioesterase PaaI [Pseudomonadota bacterium]